MSKVNLNLPKIVFSLQDEDADVLENEDTNVQTFFGYNGIFYAVQRQEELLDRRIKALESELVKLRELRRRMHS